MKFLKSLLILSLMGTVVHCAHVNNGAPVKIHYLQQIKEAKKRRFEKLLAEHQTHLNNPILDKNFLLQAAFANDKLDVEVLLEMGASPDTIISVPKIGFVSLIELVEIAKKQGREISEEIIALLETYSKGGEETDIGQ